MTRFELNMTLDTIARRFGVTPKQILGKSRRANVVKARWEVFAALKEEGLSSVAIGRLTNRDHSTVLHALAKLRGQRERKVLNEDTGFRSDVG